MSSFLRRRGFLGALAAGAGGVLLPRGAAARPAPASAAGPVVDIRDHGARGNGRFNNRLPIQRALDRCAAAGGGTVFVPAGRFVSGSLRLRSRVRLLLDSGAVLAGIADPAEYEARVPVPHTPADGWGSALLLAEGEEEISIGGQGTITGAGLALTANGEQGPFRPRLIAIERCREVRIEDVSLRDADRWTLHLYQSENVRVRGLGIHAGLRVLNTDGIDIDGCTNVVVSDCDIAVGDDCVCLKTTDYLGPAKPCSHVTVTNCILATRSSGFKLGTETHHDLTNVVFSNSVIRSMDGVEPHTGIAIETVDGGHVSGVAVSNVAMTGVVAPIFVRLGNRARRQVPPAPGTMSNVVIQNVVASGASLASSITGIPEHPVRHVSLQGIRIEARGGGGPELAARVVEERIADYPRSQMFGELPAHGLYIRHAEDISLRDVNLRTTTPDARPMLVADDVSDMRIDGLGGSSGAQHAVLLRDVREATLRGMRMARGSGGRLRVEGALSAEILGESGLHPLLIDSSAEVPADAVRVRD